MCPYFNLDLIGITTGCIIFSVNMEWPNNNSEAKEVQYLLQKKIRIIKPKKTPKYIAGVDAAFFDDKIIGVACLYKYPEIIHVEDSHSIKKVTFPYIPGFLSFREGPVIIEALENLCKKPDLLLLDGQGIAHQRGVGIASHIGVLLEIPSIGCAKSRLVGTFREPGINKGDWSPLSYKDKIVGAVLRTKNKIRPLFVSPGHLIDLKMSIEVVLSSTGKYRIPEPIRRADKLSKELKLSGKGYF
jgi:deoxyribonuclease V